jgi:xanthine/uracil permease
MGFSVFLIFLLVEIFGSPFMRNTMVIWGILGGYAIAALSSYEGESFVVSDRMKSSDVFTFLWVKTFPISVHAPAIIPMLFAFMVTAMETMGDVTATEHASRLRPSGESTHRVFRVVCSATPSAHSLLPSQHLHRTQRYPKTTVSFPLPGALLLLPATPVAFGCCALV